MKAGPVLVGDEVPGPFCRSSSAPCLSHTMIRLAPVVAHVTAQVLALGIADAIPLPRAHRFRRNADAPRRGATACATFGPGAQT
jgi:hypothetical protein